jgi:hypothetical protein
LFFERHFLAVDEATKAGSFHGADVDENVLRAVIRLDEAVAFGGVEPFNSSGRHFWVFLASKRDDVRAYAVRPWIIKRGWISSAGAVSQVWGGVGPSRRPKLDAGLIAHLEALGKSVRRQSLYLDYPPFRAHFIQVVL